MIRFDLRITRWRANGLLRFNLTKGIDFDVLYFHLDCGDLNTLSIWQSYGFGSEMDEPPVVCSFKKPSSGWDEAGWGYHWVTITTTFGILLIAIYTVAFLQSVAFAKHRLKLRISGFRLFSKLICLPMIFMIINFVGCTWCLSNVKLPRDL